MQLYYVSNTQKVKHFLPYISDAKTIGQFISVCLLLFQRIPSVKVKNENYFRILIVIFIKFHISTNSLSGRSKYTLELLSI